jgi:hypothetical protein
MKTLLLAAALLAQLAQSVPAPPQKPPDPAAIVSRGRSHAFGGLFSTVIPASCKHPRMMPYIVNERIPQKATCRVFLKFSGIPVLPTGRYRFRTWDEAGEEDSLHRIFLTDASWRGIFVQGVVGHRIFVEVTFQ